MKYVAYHRTSTKDQHLDRGIAELTKYCADNAISLYKGKVYTCLLYTSPSPRDA